MSFTKRIICLSNSIKLNECCIAGIDLDTRNWVRPVCDKLYPKDGRVPIRVARLIEGRQPELLDILEIPLASSGNNFGFECENLSVLPGQWKFIGRANFSEVRTYLRDYPAILHNPLRCVYPSYLRDLAFHQRRSLQLVDVNRMSFFKESSGWRGSLTTSNGQVLEKLKITDPVFVSKLDKGHRPTGPFLVTVSLSMPFLPSDQQGEAPCWKLIAGVIEMPQSVSELDSYDIPF